MQDISRDWKGSTKKEIRAIGEILRHEATPLAVLSFNKLQQQLGDYWYWFVLSTLWFSYSGHSDLKIWRNLFCAPRKNKKTSIMKPSEWIVFKELPLSFTVYRAHRIGEVDWISYTLDKSLAERWASQRGGYVRMYKLNKQDCLALFLRRGENEILMLDPAKAVQVDSEEQEEATN